MSAAHKITARGYPITARSNICAGTTRVVKMCEKHGAPPPVFEETQGFLVITFRAPLVVGGAAGTSRSEVAKLDSAIAANLTALGYRG